MRKSLLDKLCCPIDKGDLRLQIIKEDENQEIKEGIMTCDACGRYYPIVYGLPIMSPDEYRQKSLEEPILHRWGRALDQQAPDRFLLKE